MSAVAEKKSQRSTESKGTTARKRGSHSKDSSGPKNDDRSRSASVQAKLRHPAGPSLLDTKQMRQQNEEKKPVTKVKQPKRDISAVIKPNLLLSDKGSNRQKNRDTRETEKAGIKITNGKRPSLASRSLLAAYPKPADFSDAQKIHVKTSKATNKPEDKRSVYREPSAPVARVRSTVRQNDYTPESFEDDFEEYEEEDVVTSIPKPGKEEEEVTPSVPTHTEAPEVQHKDIIIDENLTDRSRSPTQEKATPTPIPSEGLSTIDFSKAEYNEDRWLAMQQLEERSFALKPYVQLDCETYSLCSIPPNEEASTFLYYSKTTGFEHKCLQTKDDNADKGTEPLLPFTEDKRTQHPMVRNFACTGDTESAGQISAFDSKEQRERCKKFVNHASSLLTRLIRSQRSKAVPKMEHPTQRFSNGSASFNLGLLGKRCKVTCISASSFAGKFKCIVGYQIEESALKSLEQMGLLSIVGFQEFDKPQKLLLCGAEPTCCLLHEECAWSIATSGMADGTIALWDLSEPDSWHGTIPWRTCDVSIRRATYDTAFICGDEKDMCSKVVDILVLNVQRNPADETDALQLTSLFENGQIIIWSLVKAVSAGRPLEKDGLLRPSGCVKLLKSSAIRSITTKSSLGLESLVAFCMASRGNEFFIGCSVGKVFKVLRHQETGSSIVYGSNSEISEVLSLSISPHDGNLYLAGMSSGTILLFTKSDRKPMAMLKMANEYGHLPVTCVRWSRTNPFTFYSLHSPNVFVVWNIEEGTWRMQYFVLDKSAVAMSVSEGFTSEKRKRGHVTSFLLLGYADGITEVHAMEEKLRTDGTGQTTAEIIKGNVNHYFLVP